MIKADKGHIELSGDIATMLTDLTYIIDAVVGCMEDQRNMPTKMAKAIIKASVNQCIDELVGSREIREGSRSVNFKFPDGD